MPNRLIVLALALTGGLAAASAYAIRRNAQLGSVKLHKEDLQTWEGEGGKPAAPGAHADPVN